MTPCAVAGLEPLWNCQARCIHCYYLRDSRLGTKEHRSLDEMKREVDAAQARGCNRICMVGQGEPSLYQYAIELIKYAHTLQMGTAMITNGCSGIPRYAVLYDAGMDHVLLSMHGLGETLDKIMDLKVASKQQTKFLEWLHKNDLPFRTNATVQRLNYQQLPDIAQAAVNYGARHVVMLGFLPHYEWKDHLEEVAVSPVLSAPFIEKAADIVLAAGRMITLRYQPLCVLRPQYWKYVVNARYVPFDPFEWDNGHHSFDVSEVWKFALNLGNSVAVQGEPCVSCKMQLHCGGWNRTFATHYDGCGLKAIDRVPDEYAAMAARCGGLHDLNPANAHCGNFRPATLAWGGKTLSPHIAASRVVPLPVVGT